MRHEYLVVTSQFGQATWENDRWLGKKDPAKSGSQEALDSCPKLWKYLNDKGMEGWELVAATSVEKTETTLTTLYLKRH